MSLLPIDPFLPEIKRALMSHPNLILIASPGAGKTTRVAPQLIDATSKKILMLQPRRIAARASAERIAEENHWKIGQQIGYRVRFEDRTSEQSRIIIVTEALLMRELTKDPDLSEYGIVILDEFHERNLYTDVGLAALRELQQLNRPDLKLVVMSATLDPVPLQKYLEPTITLNVPGRSHSVEVHYDQNSQTLTTDRTFIERVSKKILHVLPITEADKHLLVFLPGISEIQRVADRLREQTAAIKGRTIFALHGSLGLEEQHEVLHSQVPKIILSTNVAETSLTIDGVNTVIDSGLARELQNDQRRLFPWLKTIRISKASAEQRKGRAGRQFPGYCFRLWTKLDDQSMPAFAPPDILTQDLSEIVLTLCQLGISDPKSFSWFQPPPALSLERAQSFLQQLDLVNWTAKTTNPLTNKGRWVQSLPLPPRLGALLHRGVELNATSLAAQVVALLNERDPWNRQDLESLGAEAQDSDLIPRLSGLNQWPLPREFQLVDQSARHLCRLTKSPYQKNDLLKTQALSELLLPEFIDRLARRRRPKDRTALVVGQKGVELSPRSRVTESEFFLCLTGHANESNGNAIVDLAHPISKTLLLNQYSQFITLNQDVRYLSEKDTWMSVEQKMFRDLPMEEPNFKPAVLNEETVLKIARESFEQWKSTEDSLKQWYYRLKLALEFWPEEAWPELLQWEQETIEMACLGESSIKVIREKHWAELFCYTLPQNLKQILQKEVPEGIITPRGRYFQIHYNEHGSAQLELKIQEAFGWKETPRIAQGKLKIQLILLGPHMRPLQTTDDLASFWKGAYQELRPALKARYTRHQWPEDPTL